jgi:hypothetical protein
MLEKRLTSIGPPYLLHGYRNVTSPNATVVAELQNRSNHRLHRFEPVGKVGRVNSWAVIRNPRQDAPLRPYVPTPYVPPHLTTVDGRVDGSFDRKAWSTRSSGPLSTAASPTPRRSGSPVARSGLRESRKSLPGDRGSIEGRS